MEERDAAVRAAVDVATGRLTRRFAGATAFAIWVAVVLSELAGFESGLSLTTRLTLASVLTLVNVAVVTAPWDQMAGTAQGRRWAEGYPLVASLLFTVVYLAVSPEPLLLLASLSTAVLGASHARLPSTMALVAIPTVGALLRFDQHPALETAVFLTTLLVVTWVSATTGRLHRETLGEAIAANADAMERARQLRVVAMSARELQHLEPRKVLQALVDTTEQLGWDAAGIYARSTSGDGHVMTAHRNLPKHLTEGLQTPRGVFGEVLRTGEPVSWEDYAAHPDANPLYAEVTASAAGAPILVHGVQRGAMVTSSRTRRGITNEDLHVLEILAGQAGRALELADEFAHQQATVAELERVNQLKQDFLATVSHELRTPLAVVLGMAETMDTRWEEMPDTMRRTMTARMHTNAAGLEHVIEALLDFSRLERGIVQPRRGDVALLDLVEEVVARLETLVGDHDVQVQPGPHDGRGEAFADPLLIERVIENLIVNACRHTPPGTHVRVFVRHDGPNAVVEVADDGPGIAPDEVERLGERFFRGGDPTTRDTKGLGLGLAFCREVLAMHDSKLEITSREGVGTTFSFALARGRTGGRD